MGKLAVIKNRIYNDFLMPSRLDEYERIIKKSIELGYEHTTLKDYHEKLVNNQLGEKKYFLHRHDIDTDIRTTRAFFKIEKKYGIKTTYYFRLSTVDFELMKEIDSYGSEASYHFEEIAQYCKDNHIKKKDEVLEKLEEIKTIFKQNILYIEKSTGIKIKTVASHGDFINRKLNITNNVLTNDIVLRSEIGLLVETYDKLLMDSFDIYVSDRQYPIFYAPENIFNVLGKNDVICMLTHPRQWNTNIGVNLYDNIKRVFEELAW